uniref:Tyrosine-protein kinase receptor n=1 Tax=Timema californicum TaxID=61474 RepID=A0A7R9J0L6_TIMCA|nr:unnamed protein product [Timema californicum]
MCKNLLPDRNYSVSVAMRNGVGEGPSVSILVSTPPEQTVEDKLKPMLIISTQHKVIRQIADIVAEQVTIARRQNTITGMAIHVSRRLLFISDSGGFVKSSSLNQFSEPRVILSPEQASFSPLSLSADWLNDQLYILGEVQHPSGPRWQVARCGLDGRGLTVAVAGFLYKPQNMQVDPYNGYLFWSINGGNKKGLYKLDLADISNGVKHEVLPDIISEDPHLGAFTVDHTNSGLLVVNNTKNTVVFVSLDRNEISNLRDNATVQPMFEGATSLVTANKIFYWTRDSTLYSEEEDPSKTHYFYHSTWPLEDDGPFVSIAVELPSAQPVPVPVNPPIGVQAIMGPELAKISWQVPHLLGHQGKGAWQNWSYQVEVIEESTGQSFSCGHTNTTSYTAYHLRPGTSYLIRCYACTTGGLCPPSSEFRGKTLRAGDLPDIVWSTAEGLLKSDVTGESVKTLVHHSNLKDQQGDYHYVDITWYRDKLYMVTNTTHVHWYNLTTHMSGQLRDVDSVGSIAVDWIGRKLYWSNDKQQLITRCNLNGSQQEPLPILEYVKELVIDSVHAFLYWSSGHGVECARLNGMQRRVYYPKEIFSGKQVMGLTLDMDRQAVYWIVRSYEGSKLYQAPTAEMIPTGQKVEPIMVSNLQYKNIEGPLCYFNDHLLWLQDDRNAVIGDLSGQNAALISGMSLSGLNVVAVTDPALHRHPRDYIGGEEINVIPETVQNSSIRVSGKWEKFRIEWEPVISVNYDQVFYEVKVDTLDQGYSGKPQQEVTTDWYVGYHHVENLPPYSRLLVTVKAFTYWGASAQVRSFVHSPASTPTVPVNPRVFVSYSRSPVQDKQEIMAVFRWDPPVSRNGVIEGYRVKSWLMAPEGEIHMNDSFLAGVENREYIARQLLHNATYFFEVQAFTVMGDGPTTNPVQADLDVETPVPKLLLSTPDAIKVTDCDRHENQTLSLSSGPPVDVAFMGQEGRVFWVSEMQELISSDMDGGGKVKMLVLNGTGLSITVDWVGRYIYWSEMDETGSGSAIFRLDLSQQGSVQPELVLRRNRLIHKVDISPFQSSLYWVETSRAGIGHLMTRKTNTGDVRPFFTVTTVRRKRESEACNCPDNPAVGQAMSIDQTDPGNPRVLWVDGWHGDIYMADTRGCHCTVLVNATVNTETGLPPTSVTTDHRLLYWSNSTEGRIYSVVKPTSAAQRQNKELEYMSSGVTRIDVSGVRRITALGLHLQPYPVRKCLWPRDPEAAPTLHARSAQSITLSLPQPRRERECGDVSMATIEYTVYYGPAGGWDCGSSLHECVSVVTYSSTFEVTGLRPFHRYVFRVALRNYYSDLERISPVIGPAVILRTAPGAPSPPRNVTAVVLNPTVVEVSWLPPQEFNDETVSYQVHWRSEEMVGGERRKGEKIVSGPSFPDAIQTASLSLLAGQTYFILVRANSSNSATSSDSGEVQVQMFPEPNDILLLYATAYSLNISWSPSPNVSVVRREIQWCEMGSGQWQNLPLQDATGEVNYYMRNLRPKTQYTFRLTMEYAPFQELYVWPLDGRFTYETLGDRPSPPGVPKVQQLGRDTYQVWWEPSQENGAVIDSYSLEGMEEGGERRDAGNHSAQQLGWDIYYNGSENYWNLSKLSPSLKYTFRARARNKHGWSDYGGSSRVFDLTAASMLADSGDLNPILYMVLPVGVSVCVLVVCALLYVLRRRDPEGKDPQVIENPVRPPDVELATLRELPRRGNFVHNSNALYTTAEIPTDEEIASLPHIRRGQIKLTKFLGSGAFGEVFEGNAHSLVDSSGSETKVAIKTLRKGATEQEKGEFLKEAQLMSHFKHEHILQLLGVCLDNDPNYIIMELMEGGDLLSYLRASRSLLYPGNTLTLQDLLTMCVDVARGCRYLEEMHFVHRDLACRNCLVSSSDPRLRVVKIGDFGLARDIYKNDYYRKEGEGLLPVRWMAPESLVDGVFTSQSDMWAFGVLVWEIMTLGQQPYPARTNLEVLHYVRTGGRLGRPSNCPEELHQLMLKCWSYNPESRPTFKYCLDVLLELKDHVSLSDVQNVSRTASGGIENRGFFEDENHNNSSGSSWKTGSDAGSRDQIPILPSNAPGDIPRYLELLYDDSDNTTVSDGYEIPRPPPPSAAVSKTPSATNTLDRHRTLSTSSTVSDSSISYQQALLANPETPVSRNIKRTLSLEPRRNGDTDVSTLQHLLSAQLCTYSNAAEQPLLDAAKVTSLSCSNSFNVTDEHVRT